MPFLSRVSTRPFWLAMVVWAVLPAPDRSLAANDAITVSSNFEGGSAVVVQTQNEPAFVHLQPQVEPGRGFPCWWYCRIDHAVPGRSFELKVSGGSEPFQNSRVLAAGWSLPDRAAISVDDQHWTQTPVGSRQGDAMTYRFEAPASTFWLAWGPPFLPRHAEQLLSEAKQTLPEADVFELAKTRGGRSVPAIRFGAQPTEETKPFGIWIQARQHAWEAGSSWVASGLLKWLISEDPEAIKLRQISTIHLVPLMDIDSVAEGCGGKDAIPRDHNRDWDDSPVYPEVKAAQQSILALQSENRFDVFFDLHNPAPGDRRPFFFGPKLESLSEQQQHRYWRWIALAHSQIESLEDRYRFTSYIPTSEELNRVSSNWVRNHTSEHALSATLETAWNRPEGTQQGYEQVGRQLGQALSRYLSENPRSPTFGNDRAE